MYNKMIYKQKDIKARTADTNYFLYTFSDGSAALMYDNGYTTGIWCGVKTLKAHLSDLKKRCGWADLIPADWEIVDANFFKALNIL